MGVVDGISFKEYPRQGELLGKKVRVCFHYNNDEYYEGECIRDDRERPGETIFKLDNGRVLRAAECQYSWDD